LRLELLDLEPPIWRMILVPETLTLATLDRVAQAAMGWTNSHLNSWRIAGTRCGIRDPERSSVGAQRVDAALSCCERRWEASSCR
jgi:hypothetical protein